MKYDKLRAILKVAKQSTSKSEVDTALNKACGIAKEINATKKGDEETLTFLTDDVIKVLEDLLSDIALMKQTGLSYRDIVSALREENKKFSGAANLIMVLRNNGVPDKMRL